MGDATEQGVSRTKRDQDMEDLLARREQENTGETEEELEASEEEPVKKPAKEPKEDIIRFTDADGNTYNVPKNAQTNLKVDGKEVTTPVDQITRRYQKGAAGDKRLQEANSFKKQLEEKERNLTAKEQEFLKQYNQAKKQISQGNLSNDDYQKKVRNLISAVVEADEDKAVEIFSDVYKPAPQPSFDPKTINRAVDERVQARMLEKEQAEYRQRLTDANERFMKDYKDLADDSMLYNMVDTETARINQERPGAEPWEIISEAAENVKTWKDGMTKPSRKKKVTTPTPASGRASIGEDEKPVTRKDILNDMRRARGQPPT